MRKSVDPNLNNSENQDVLFGEDKSTTEQSTFQATNDVVEKTFEDTGSLTSKTIEEITAPKTEEHTHHSSHSHHHSSGSHHHHHSSSGSHHSHHSGGSHHHHSSKHHHSSHSKKDKKKKTPTWLKVIIAIILIIALLITSIFGAYTFLKNQGANDLSSVAKTDTNHQEIISYKGHKYEFNDDVVAMAFMGVDQRELLSTSQVDFVGCTDADIVITVDTKTGAVKLIALPRDTMVDVDQYSSNNVFLKTSNVQLCLAYAYGDGGEKSCKNVVDAMSRILLNVPIQKYLALDLSGIAPLNDAIGGVTVDAIYDIPNYNIKNGEKVTLKGDMAEAYVRTRDMDTIDASLHRTKRQIQYVQAYINQVIPAVKNDVTIVSDLYNTATKYSRTNLSLNNVTYLSSLLLSKGIDEYKVYQIKGEMTAEKEPKFPDVVYAQFHPYEESIMETVLDVFYTQID